MSHPVAGVDGPIEVIGCHAAGEIGDVIVSGVAPPPGETIWEQSRWLHRDGALRRHLLDEPRGGVFKHVNLLVPAIHPDAAIGFIIMEPMFTPPMSGSNSICVATVVLETGIVEMKEPVTTAVLEAPAGLVEVTAECRDGKVQRVSVRNVASFAGERDVALDVPGIGQLRADTAWGGDSFVMVDAVDLGIDLVPERGRDLAEAGQRIRTAANEQLRFAHPELDWPDISFCQIAGPLERTVDGEFTMRNTVVIDPGKLDRSPTGTGLSARLALLHAQGIVDVGDTLRMRSIIDSEFSGRLVSTTMVGDRAAVVPEISGSAWRTGHYVYDVDPTDPWPLGYRIGDTWPMG